MLPTHLNVKTLRNPERVSKRLAQMLTIASKTIELPSGHWTSVSDKIDIAQALDWYHSISIHFGDKMGRDRYQGELRLFTDGESSHKHCRGRAMLFLRYGRPYNFESEDLVDTNEDRFAYEANLAAVIRNLVNVANQTIQAHSRSLSQQNWQ